VSQTEEFIDADSLKEASKKGGAPIKGLSAKKTLVVLPKHDKKDIKPKVKILPKVKVPSKVTPPKKGSSSSLKVVSTKKVTKPSLVIAGAEEEPSLKDYGADQSNDKSPSQLSTEALLFSEKALGGEQETKKEVKKQIVIKPKAKSPAPVTKKPLKITPKKKAVSLPPKDSAV
jgi:hypothetical protein